MGSGDWCLWRLEVLAPFRAEVTVTVDHLMWALHTSSAHPYVLLTTEPSPQSPV